MTIAAAWSPIPRWPAKRRGRTGIATRIATAHARATSRHGSGITWISSWTRPIWIGPAAAGRALPSGTPASAGPAAACIVDKIEQFVSGAARSVTRPASERRLALQFLLHLWAICISRCMPAMTRTRAGISSTLTARGWPGASLHHYWDVEFVQCVRAGRSPVAEQLIGGIGPRGYSSLAEWQHSGLGARVIRAWPSVSPTMLCRRSQISAADTVFRLRIRECGDRGGAPAADAVRVCGWPPSSTPPDAPSLSAHSGRMPMPGASDSLK